jgi:hypothetical protein
MPGPRKPTGDENVKVKLVKLALTLGSIAAALVAGAANFKVG